MYPTAAVLTLQVKKDVRLVVLEHLGHQLDVHVLDVDLLEDMSIRDGGFKTQTPSYLQSLVHDHDGLI